MPIWFVHFSRKMWSWGKLICSNNPLILLVLKHGLGFLWPVVLCLHEQRVFFFLQKHQLCFLVYQISNILLRENIVSYKEESCVIALAFFHLGFHQPFCLWSLLDQSFLPKWKALENGKREEDAIQFSVSWTKSTLVASLWYPESESHRSPVNLKGSIKLQMSERPGQAPRYCPKV